MSNLQQKPLELKRCQNGGKPCYDKKGAQTAKNKRWQQEHVALRIYQCDFGDHWHLTHADPYREERNLKIDKQKRR
jgi:hypothetical protein